ncbi:MAG TPA: cell division topological specificity factor MinE, partial [Marinobacter hydrocarbonoclasticus]|nr:cell division topological specificity factor MinE [Marinobacter nauticus]
KERLQIIVAHERGQREQPDYLPQLQQELLQVIRKYVQISDDMVQVEVDRNDHCSVLELNVTLPEK